MRRKRYERLLLALLAVALYVLPYLGSAGDDDLAEIALFLLLGLPMLVGALVRSKTVLAVPALVVVLLFLSLYVGLGDDSELWSDDALNSVAVVMAAIYEVGSAAIGIAVGNALARRRNHP